MSTIDQRVHARIHIRTEIEIVLPDGVSKQVFLVDLSKGGARLSSDTPIDSNTPIDLLLPSLMRNDIVVRGTVLRSIADDASGRHFLAVRFDEVDPSMERDLLELIEVLLSTSSHVEQAGRRSHARVARRIEVHFGSLPELGAILEDISAGGLSMSTAEPLVLYEELDVAIPDTQGEELLILHARVVHQRRVEPAEDGSPQYRVGLQFGELRRETRRCLEALLESVLEISATVGDGP